ncbi:MAG TPA: SdrD B-like domain-containing protein [Thermoanaerobaculia bacterium]|nr:SdrD B-like domain-containing protein [Thermoanaerobaculia bacterium]
MAQFKCFPSCSTTDARFLVIASGPLLVTLSDPLLDIELAVPAGTPSFQVGLFDGDSGGAHWDLGTVPYSYTLYADPLGTGSQTTTIEMVPGFPSVSSLSMPDNAWIDFTVNTTVDARSPSGNYIYHLRIVLLNTAVNSFNSFKLRTTGISMVRLEDQPFSYMATLASFADLLTIYPSFPSLTPTPYDGTFRFFFYVLDPGTDIAAWDGDFDHGKFDGTELDTDDPDTPNSPFRPPWATADAVSEGVAVGLPPTTTGNPADDASPADAIFLRPPSVRYDLIFPDSQSFANNNPSGNQEWEQFRISTDPFNPALMDYSTASIPGGTFELRATGVDLANLNALRLPDRALCVSDTFEPCTPLFPFLVGDTVFSDIDGNGVQSGAGEGGIPGVVVELVGRLGSVIGTTTTDASGHYAFNVPAGTYTVRVAASNFASGGRLAGAISTTGNQKTETVIDNNVLTYDFGYRGSGSIGDFVWFDNNEDGLQNDGPSSGLGGVRVILEADFDGNGSIDATLNTITAADGSYLFTRLLPGTYRVRIDTSTLASGLAPTFDLDGTGTPHVATVVLGGGASNRAVDFGYGTGEATGASGALGDQVWRDSDGDGVVDSAEIGIDGITVRLLGDIDGDGINELDRTAVTAEMAGVHGLYGFTQLPEGRYTVSVVASTLPAGYVQTYDADGLNTPNAATVTLEADETNLAVDFGYRPAASPGTGTPGYWKNHPEAWPVDQITIGGVTYTKEQALYWLGQSDDHDKTITLFRALVAAKLNVAIGNLSSCIEGTINSADQWMATYGPVGSGVTGGGSNSPWRTGEPLYLRLDDYNNGRLCAPHRS